MTVIEHVFDVLGAVGEWITTTLPGYTVLFYSPETGLTFLGVLSLASLGVSISFLLLSIIQGFLHFRG